MYEKLYHELLIKYNELEQENKQLRKQLDLMDENDKPLDVLDCEVTINKYSSPTLKVKLFRSLFKGRDDVFAKRWNNKASGKSGYQPVCKNEWIDGVCDKKKNKCSRWSTQEIIAKVDADCESDGTKAHWHCNACDKDFDEDKETELTDLTISPLGHNSDGTVDHKDAKCTETGVVGGTYCTRCNDGKEAAEATINALGHAWSTDEIIAEEAANCTETGIKAHWHCNSCNKDFESDKTTEIGELTIAAKGHNYGDWIAEVPATVESEGTKAHKDCTACGKHFDNDGNEITDLTIPKLELPTDPDTPITPTDPTTPSGEQKDGLSGGAIAGIAIGSVAVAGLGGFAIFWFVIKKKKWADLVAVFKNLFAKK